MKRHDDYRTPAKTEHCELCGRVIGQLLTKHHLIPRTLHNKKRIRKSFERTEVKTRILWLCRPCHTHIHQVCSEKELADQYNQRTVLLEHPEIQRFVDWIKDKPIGFQPTSRSWKRS